MKVFTYNIRKGMRPLFPKKMVSQIKQALDQVDAELVFLQEVLSQVENFSASQKSEEGTSGKGCQHVILAGRRWEHLGYTKARDFKSGVMGNAILSKYPIVTTEALDITVLPFEPRAMLYCEIRAAHWPESIHALCVHLSLFVRGRRRQYQMIGDFIRERLGTKAPLILAGDFNDWRREACRALEPLGLIEAHAHADEMGRYAASFPSRFPVFSLDRIYVRGLEICEAKAHRELNWAGLSDHIPVSAELQMLDNLKASQDPA